MGWAEEYHAAEEKRRADKKAKQAIEDAENEREEAERSAARARREADDARKRAEAIRRDLEEQLEWRYEEVNEAEHEARKLKAQRDTIVSALRALVDAIDGSTFTEDVQEKFPLLSKSYTEAVELLKLIDLAKAE